jgi:hypothetical protein
MRLTRRLKRAKKACVSVVRVRLRTDIHAPLLEGVCVSVCVACVERR